MLKCRQQWAENTARNYLLLSLATCVCQVESVTLRTTSTKRWAIWPTSPELAITADDSGDAFSSGVLLSDAVAVRSQTQGEHPTANKYYAGYGDDPDGDVNASATHFATCSQACHQCFVDHYQGCLAYCDIGCEDYCTVQLPAVECEQKAEWTANVAHVFQAFDSRARMCASTGFNGCPFKQAARRKPVDPYPYTAAEDDELRQINKTRPAVKDSREWK
eukprot:TRINITY_DN80285_c0_g1_i1.p1 TRINITY_DN80285_c0_g1~~TRINITY_DN80285_c0_g1_i1.p1  ORF type:complete len:219 (+),score=22.13 TRINITY_DN80285_c0_g1_i1:89-745(+)